MSIFGNVILPQKDGFVYGANQPGVPCLWFNTNGAVVPDDPDVVHGLLMYLDSEDTLNPLYPMTTVAAVYGLTQKLIDLSKADTEVSEKLDGKIKKASVALPADGWNEKSITVNVDGVSNNNTIIVSCAAESYEAYCEAAVRCTGQGDGTLSFACDVVPDSSVTVNIVILNEVGT